MKLASCLMLVISLLVVFTSGILAQNPNSAAETAENLRAQLRDVQAREAELQARLKQLEEDMKPENIERSLAGVGSTKPEELRELRRSQLSREKEGIVAQLELLAKSRTRLESAILTAEGAAYHQSAQGTTTPADPMLMAQSTTTPRWLVASLAGVIAIVALGAGIIAIRKLKRT